MQEFSVSGGVRDERLERRAQGHSGNVGQAHLTVYEFWLFRNHYCGSTGGKEAARKSKFLGLSPENTAQSSLKLQF